jgi:hypothetical protein
MRKKPPEKPEDIFAELSQDLTGELGADLLGICLFGSAAAGRYVKGTSDLNLLILVADGARKVTSRLMPFYKKWAPAGVSPPLVLSPEYIASSLDVFPIEFLVMAAGHLCIHGQDPFENLQVEPKHLRLQLERELKGKLTTLRTRLLASGGNLKALTALASEALPAFTAFFQAWLQLTKGRFPQEPEMVLAQAREAGLEVEAYAALQRVRRGDYKPEAKQMVDLWEEGIFELEDICRQVDALQL